MTDNEPIALDEEAASLPIHVRMCAFRHRQILEKIEELDTKTDRRLSRIEKAAWAIVGLLGTGLGAGVTQVLPIMRAMAGQ